MEQSIEDILNGPDYFKCDRYQARMKKVRCVEKQAGPQAGFEIDYADTMCRDCAQGIEIKGEVQGLDIKQIRRERREFAYRQQGKVKKQKRLDSRLRGNDDDGQHIESAVAEAMADRKEGEGMVKCLVKDCEKEGKHRGLCSAHIQRFRKGTLPGIEPLPSNRGKSPKKDRLNKIKESAVRVKKVRNQESETKNRKVEIIPVVSETVSDGFISSVLPINVEKMEEQNRADVRVFARAFVAGLKSEFIAAMTEQMSSAAEATADKAE